MNIIKNKTISSEEKSSFHLHKFENCIFTGYEKIRFSKCEFINCSFSDFLLYQFEYCSFAKCEFINCSTVEHYENQFWPSLFNKCRLEEVKFEKSLLHHFQIDDSLLKKVEFRACHLGLYFKFIECDISYSSHCIEFRECTVEYDCDIWENRNLKEIGRVFSPRICLAKTSTN